jgi:polysaccharide deacetylase 2 family uncharacterized protein YibQ
MMTARLCAFLISGLFLFPAAAERPRVAIIIDDLGYQLEAGRRAISLPGPVSYAVLPGTPRARQLAQAAHQSGKEVILHLPLQSIDHRGPAEPGGIMLDMSRQRLQETFRAAIDSVPFAIGVNSHRGSLLTRHPGHMRWLMDEIRDRDDLFFIDSYTTHESIALQIAGEAGVAAVKRDVFLDPDASAVTLEREFRRMKALARSRGTVIAIGHPYPATLELLERELPKLASEGIELIPISRVFAGDERQGSRVNERIAAMQ